MRVHRISIRNFRAIDAVDLDLATTGVTIIEGPNETGKTSVADALSLLLNERDDTTKASVKALRPVGTDAGPEVECEFASGKYRFTYRKRWLKNKETVLTVIAPKPENLAGREAHDRVRAILEETMDDSLWSALRLEQNAPLEQAAFAGGSLGRALDAAAGGTVTSGDGDDLWERVRAERDRYWTATGQAKSDLLSAGRRVEECVTAVDTLRLALASVEDDIEKVAALQAEQAELATQIAANTSALAELQQRESTITELRASAGRLEHELELADTKAQHAENAAQDRADLLERVEKERRNVEATEHAIASAATNIESAKEELARADGKVTAARDVAEATRTAQTLARDDRDHRHRESELERLTERYDRALAAIEDRDRAQAAVDATRVTDELLEDIERANSALLVARTRAELAAATVELSAATDLAITVNDVSQAVPAGTSHSEAVTEPTRIDIAGVGSVAITPGSTASELNDAVDRAVADLNTLLMDAGAENVDAARGAYRAFRDALHLIGTSEETIHANLRDLTLDQAAAKIERLTARISEYAAGRDSDAPMPDTLDAAEDALRTADDALDIAASTQQDCEGAREAKWTALREVEDANASAQAAVDGANGRFDVENGRLEAAREVASDETARVEAALRRSEADDARSAHEAALNALKAADADSFDVVFKNAKDTRGRLEARRVELDIELAGLRARIDSKGDEGIASALDDAETRLAHAQTDHERISARAAAALLLHDAFARRRSEARHRYVAPFRERIEAFGRIVFGNDFAVELDEDLRIVRRTLRGETLDFTSLSTGTKEQLGLISRLACAALVADEEGAPVIFDDALGWSDPTRLDRMGAVISSAGDNCQVIILTCTPGRYASVGKASVIRI